MSGNSLYLNIVYATDSRYLFPTLVATCSAILWASDVKRLRFHILDCGIDDLEWNKYERTVFSLGGQAIRHEVNLSKYKGMPFWHGSMGAYARLELPSILKNEDWCVYCDGDTLFTQDPLLLFNVYDSKYSLMGHHDDFDNRQVEWHQKNNVEFVPEKRVCSGFLLINLDWFRKQGFIDECFLFLRKHPDVINPDQDALNFVCRKSIGILPDGWGNFVNYRDHKKSDFRGCMHYTVKRPWEIQSDRRFQLVPQVRLWFNIIHESCGILHPLCPKKVRRWYLIELIRLYVYSFIFYSLNIVPYFRGRYRHVLNELWWTKKEMNMLKPAKKR